MTIESIAATVLHHRKNMGVRAAAKEIGISPTTLTRLEKGHVPDVGTLNKVCAWLGMDSSQFTGIGNLQVALNNRKAAPEIKVPALAKLIVQASKRFADEVDARGH